MKGVVLCLLLALAKLSLARIEEHKRDKTLLIRKCCPEGQQLEHGLENCVPYEDIHSHALTNLRHQMIGSVITKERPDFPWWMDSKTLPLSSSTFSGMESFLAHQNENKYIEYGVKQPCESHVTKILKSTSNEYVLLDNGTLIYYPNRNGSNSSASFAPTTYCADRVDLSKLNKSEGAFVYLLCPCMQVPCVRKCCSPNKVLIINERRKDVGSTCKKASDVVWGNSSGEFTPWRPEFHHNQTVKLSKDHTHALLYSKGPNCGEGRNLVVLNQTPGKEFKFWVYGNGSALVEEFGFGVPYSSEHYCADMSVLEGGQLLPNVLVCVKTITDQEPDNDGKFYGAMFVIGSVFLTATLLVYAVLPHLRTLNGKTLMAHASSLLVAYIVLATGQLRPRMEAHSCISLAFIIQFSFLAAFFWLNVMCIDISWAFSGFRPPQGSVTERDRKKFLYYSLYAWGSPTVISIVTAIMEYVEEIPDTYIKPNFGVRACWFETKPATLAYFYGPMAALLLMNFALFLYTTIKIVLVQRATRILHNGESGRHDGSNFKKDKKRLMLYGKLFCLMGLTWITEIVSWATGSAQHYWYVTDGINLLRAVFIFIIFCCKPKVFRLLKQRLHQWGLFPSLGSESETNRSGGTRKSSSSTQQSSLQMSQLNSNTNP